MRHAKAFGAAVLAALISSGMMFMLPVGESTATMVAAWIAMAGWSAVTYQGRA